MIYICTQKSVLINVLLSTVLEDDINKRLQHSLWYPDTPMQRCPLHRIERSLKQRTPHESTKRSC